eukprot:10338808-Heterocapsa_arctica.AAC.1
MTVATLARDSRLQCSPQQAAQQGARHRFSRKSPLELTRVSCSSTLVPSELQEKRPHTLLRGRVHRLSAGKRHLSAYKRVSAATR